MDGFVSDYRKKCNRSTFSSFARHGQKKNTAHSRTYHDYQKPCAQAKLLSKKLNKVFEDPAVNFPLNAIECASMRICLQSSSVSSVDARSLDLSSQSRFRSEHTRNTTSMRFTRRGSRCSLQYHRTTCKYLPVCLARLLLAVDVGLDGGRCGSTRPRQNKELNRMCTHFTRQTFTHLRPRRSRST